MNASAAKGINAHSELHTANGIHVQHVGEIVNVSIEVIVPMCCGGTKSLTVRHSLHTLHAVLQKLIGPSFDLAGHANIC